MITTNYSCPYLVLLTLLEQGGTGRQVAALADYATVAPSTAHAAQLGCCMRS